MPVFSETIQGNVEFDWISKTQIQRDANIKEVHDILFENPDVKKYPKSEFKARYSAFTKDKDYIKNYVEIKNGKREDAEKIYAGFFLKNGLFIVYGIQYKNNMKTIYDYDVMGNLRYLEIFSDDYPDYPCYSLQYSINGKLVGKFYYVSKYDQYYFDPNGVFKGRWYKENLYNRNAKAIMTRSNY